GRGQINRQQHLVWRLNRHLRGLSHLQNLGDQLGGLSPHQAKVRSVGGQSPLFYHNVLVDHQRELRLLCLLDEEVNISRYESRRDMVERIYRSRGCVSEYLLDLLTGRHVAT